MTRKSKVMLSVPVNFREINSLAYFLVRKTIWKNGMKMNAFEPLEEHKN